MQNGILVVWDGIFRNGHTVALFSAVVTSFSNGAPPVPEDAGTKDSPEPLSVIVFCKPIKFATSSAIVTYYVYETNEAGSEQFGLMISGTNSRKLEFGGLTTGKVYYFYIRAKTSAGFGPPSKVLRWVGR